LGQPNQGDCGDALEKVSLWRVLRAKLTTNIICRFKRTARSPAIHIYRERESNRQSGACRAAGAGRSTKPTRGSNGLLIALPVSGRVYCLQPGRRAPRKSLSLFTIPRTIRHDRVRSVKPPGVDRPSLNRPIYLRYQPWMPPGRGLAMNDSCRNCCVLCGAQP
jgi:hypothetical protein